MNESWRIVWRSGFCPVLSNLHLEALRDALKTDDPRLTQGSTTTPPPLMCVQSWSVEAGDFLAYMGAMELGGFCVDADGKRNDNPNAATVGQCEEFFARCCFEADQRMSEPAACRWTLNWFDDTPRDEMRRELLFEVEHELRRRLDNPPNPSDARYVCAGKPAGLSSGDEAQVARVPEQK